jgi:hypothetical protein
MKTITIMFSACVLLLPSLLAAASRTIQGRWTSTPVQTGTILYVGGSGPGNYTRIQDAINASVDGDMVFVYDDLAPYHEQLTINKTISLVEESAATTVIDGSKTLAVMIFVFANSALWHGRIDLPHLPRFEVDWHPAQQPSESSPS